MAGQENTQPSQPDPAGASGPIPNTPRLELDNTQNSESPKKAVQGSPVVRFASEHEEIEPAHSLDNALDTEDQDDEKVKALTQTLQGVQLAGRRMSCFAFEPVSLPASRVPSHDDSSREASRHNTRTSTGKPSPHQSPVVKSMHSPPITPAATRSREEVRAAKDAVAPNPLEKVEPEESSSAFTPQVSPPITSPSTTLGDSRPGSSGVATKESSVSQSDEPAESHSKHHPGNFTIGPSPYGSSPVSRETSPGRGTPTSRLSTATIPGGDANDPYAAHRRRPQSKNLDAIDQRFKFQSMNSKQRNSTVGLPRSASSKSTTEDKRSSRLFPKSDTIPREDSSTSLNHKSGSSMANLTRFLKIGHSHKQPKSRTASPTPSIGGGGGLPFDDAHGLITKYGKFGKVLGAGAGGSVRIIKRSDGTTFAVKQFRARHTHETKKEYAKKVTAEFCVGSALHHGNIIETLDIINEKDTWYEVMEYAPYDLFAAVMTGKMSKEEVNCCFLQSLSGVAFLHSSGLAHRDLKLDNIVVNEHGILKIIDFGSAFVFKYPFENGINLASGVVGSDPYLAPEVLDERKYDPQPADIWSLAIIFCCMSLRRFPWKNPRMTDNSYKLFASAPSPIKAVTGTITPSDVENPVKSDKELTSEEEKKSNGEKVEKRPEVIKGPFRLLRLLPKESRHIIGRMLEIDPRRRAKMQEVISDPWISGTDCCRQDNDGTIHRAAGHVHTLEPPAPSPPAK